MAKPTIYCGIDLGTTNSTVSVIPYAGKGRSNPMELLKTCPIYQYDGNFHYDKDSYTLPSALYFDLDKNVVYTGNYAKKMYASGDRPMQTVRSVKTRIGGESMVEIPAINNSTLVQHFDMVECSALFLKTILQSLKSQFVDSIEEVVITVPAAFNNDERQATANAVFLAGFKKCFLLDEPTATLLYYINSTDGLYDQNIDTHGEYKLVYDIGGGTLDVSIAKVSEDDEGDMEINIVARSPRMDLGGDDFDQYLGAYFLSEFEKVRKPIHDRTKEDQNRIIARIVSRAENEKIEINDKIRDRMDDLKKLSKLKQYVEFELIDDMSIPELKLTKDILDKIYNQLVYSEDALVLKPIKDSLKEAGLNRNQISQVITTGGMSNFYAVEEALRKYFGNDVRIIQVDPVTSVSKGAAIHHFNLHNTHADVKKLKLKDRMVDDIFIKVGEEFKLLFSREVRPLDSGIFEYEILESGMTEVPIFLYYGLGNSPENYTPISGKFIGLNHSLNKGQKINLKWTLNKDKIINVEIDELGETFQIERSKLYTVNQINRNHIQNLKINGGE